VFDEFVSRFGDLLAPLACIQCRNVPATPDMPLCRSCIERLAWWRRVDGCPRCGAVQAEPGACPGCYSSGSALHRCHTLLHYDDISRDWIPRFKQRSSAFGPALDCRIAIEFLADELARRLAMRRAAAPDLIIPIALHPRRLRQRGFNQSAAIAQRIAKCLGLRLAPDALVRRRHTPPQATLGMDERRSNLRGAFRARRRLDAFERVWLVDDVLTTGATLDSAAEACLAAGVGEVHGLTLAATTTRRPESRGHERSREVKTS
jgi:ComF family protein